MLVMYVHKTTWSDKAGVFTRVLGSGIKNWTGKGWKDENGDRKKSTVDDWIKRVGE